MKTRKGKITSIKINGVRWSFKDIFMEANELGCYTTSIEVAVKFLRNFVAAPDMKIKRKDS